MAADLDFHFQSPTPVSEMAEKCKEECRPKRATLFFALLLSFAALVCFLWLNIWPETARREAYLPELEELVHSSPYNGRLLALVGGRQIESHDYDLAEASLSQAMAAGEDTALVRLNLAAVLEANGKRPLALAHLKLALQAHPQDEQLKAALTRIQKIAVPAPVGALAPALCPEGSRPLVAGYTKGSFLNGVAQWWGHRYPEKSGYMTRSLWVTKQPENAQAQRLWGLALIRNRRIEEAEVFLKKAVSLDPESVEAHLALGEFFEQINQNAAASLEYIDGLKIQRDNLLALLGLGRVSLKGGRLGTAVRSFQRAREVDPTSVEAWAGLGRCYQLTGLGYDKSVEAYKKAEELAPENTDFMNDYAVSLYRMGRQSEAEVILRKRVQEFPKDPLTHHLLGMVLMNINATPERIAEGEKHTRESLTIHKGNVASTVQLAQLLLIQNKEAKECVRLLQHAIRVEPRNRTSRFLLARAYRQLGQKVAADKAAAEGDKLFKMQQMESNLAEKERKNQLDISGRQQLINHYESIGKHNEAQLQRQILALQKADPQAPTRIKSAYAKSIDEVLGPAKNALERD